MRLTATVPTNAPYGSAQAVRLENVTLNGGAIGAVGDVAVHKVVYLGDADDSGIHSSADAFLTVQEGLGLTEPFVPDNPHIAVTPVGGGIDPRLQIGGTPSAETGDAKTVPIQLDVESSATNVGGIDFDLLFDPSQLTIQVPGGVVAGADTISGWAVMSTLVAPGHVRVALMNGRGQALATGLREIAQVQFHVAETAAAGLDGLETHPTLADGSETHPTWLDLEPVDAQAGGYAWTATDGSIAIVVPNAWHNTANPFDVTGDGVAAPNDLLLLINYINAHPGETALPPAPTSPSVWYDVSRDNRCSALDVLLVINHLNAQVLPAAEGEPAALTAPAVGGLLERPAAVDSVPWRMPIGRHRSARIARDMFFQNFAETLSPPDAVLGELAEDLGASFEK